MLDTTIQTLQILFTEQGGVDGKVDFTLQP